MRLVLDTNEWIGALSAVKNPSGELLLDFLLESSDLNSIHVPRLIINEVKRNLSLKVFKEFLKIIEPLANIDEDAFVPFELGARYESRGLKPADAFIAAYAQWIQADI